jgi:DNA-binding MarR family transcriptional regulator
LREILFRFSYPVPVGDEEKQGGAWTLLTGHGHVLVEIARNPDARLRDIAAVAGITERAVQAIISDLEATGYVTRERAGRRNRYTVHAESLFRHPAQEGHRVGPVLDILAAESDPALPSNGADEKETGRGRKARSASAGNG